MKLKSFISIVIVLGCCQPVFVSDQIYAEAEMGWVSRMTHNISQGYDLVAEKVEYLATYKQAILTTAALLTCMYTIKKIREYSLYQSIKDQEFIKKLEEECSAKTRNGQHAICSQFITTAKKEYKFLKGMPELLDKFSKASAAEIIRLKEEIKTTLSATRTHGLILSWLIGAPFTSPLSISTPFS